MEDRTEKITTLVRDVLFGALLLSKLVGWINISWGWVFIFWLFIW